MISEYDEEINDEIHDVVIFYNDIELCHDMQIDFNKFQRFFFQIIHMNYESLLVPPKIFNILQTHINLSFTIDKEVAT